VKIAILKTDSVLAKFKNQYGEYPQMLEGLLSAVHSEIQFETFDVVEGQYPFAADHFDGYFIMGSKASVYDSDSWITQLGKYVQELHADQKKLVGICFGHQLLANVLGGSTQKSDKGWGVGVHKSRLIQAQSWMGRQAQDFSLLVSHQDQVVQLPPGAVHIAGSDFCQYSMFSIDEHVLGLQGHPEFSGAYAQALMGHRRESLGESTYSKGVASLAQSTQEKRVAQWMISFLA